jgi:hypothetical protein
MGSDGGLEGDGVAEGFELADVGCACGRSGRCGRRRTPGGGRGGGEWVGQQVPGDDQDGAPGGDDGEFGAAAAGDAAVPFAEEGVCLGGAGRGVAQDDGQVGVAVAGVLPGPLPPSPAPVPARGRLRGGARSGRPLRLAYADPPYPGRARLYRGSPGLRWRSRPAALLECLAAYDG